MPKPRVIVQPTSTEHFSLGINAVADLLAPTLGPIGGVVANQRDFKGRPELLDDSATAVRRILNLGDPRMDVGAMLMRSLVWRAVQRAGDGGATAAVLARALYLDAVRLISAGANAMQMAKGINLGVEEAVRALKTQARPVQYEDDLAAVALTVIRQPGLAAVLGEMSYLLGPDAHVSIEKFVAPYLQQFYHPGANYRAQIASMYLYTDRVHKRAVLPPGVVALVDGKLDQIDQAASLLDAAVKAGAKSLTVVASSFSDEVIGVMVANSNNHKMSESGNKQIANGDGKKDKTPQLTLVGAKLKDVGDARRDAYDDLAMLTGATVLGRGWSKPVEMVSPDDLGRSVRAEVSTDMLHIVPEQKHGGELQAKAAEIRTRLAEMTMDDEERPNLTTRLSALSGGMGVLKVGSDGKLDRELMAKNAERALKVLSAAQYGGVVPGGGAALFHCIPALDSVDAEGDISFGVDVVRRTLGAPLRQILDNAHVPSSSVIMEQVRDAGPTATYDVMNGRVADAYEVGVLDVTNVLSTVLQSAVSGALMAVTTDAIVYHKNPEQAFTP